MKGGDHAGAEDVVSLEDEVVQYEHDGYRENDPGENGSITLEKAPATCPSGE
jgi:hypothetical protein